MISSIATILISIIIKVNIEDDIESKISKCTVMRKLDQTRARNEPFKFTEHRTFEEFKNDKTHLAECGYIYI